MATFLILAQDASGDDRHGITYMIRCMHSKALVTLRVSGGEAHVRRLASTGASAALPCLGDLVRAHGVRRDPRRSAVAQHDGPSADWWFPRGHRDTMWHNVTTPGVPGHVCLFSGLGSWTIAAGHLGIPTRVAVDLDTEMVEIHRTLHTGTLMVQTDINDLAMSTAWAPTEPDLLTASPPCQPFTSLRMPVPGRSVWHDERTEPLLTMPHHRRCHSAACHPFGECPQLGQG